MSIPNPHYIIVSAKLGPSKKPKYHQTEEDALAEAERLALLHRDDSFQVYKSHRFLRARMVDVFDNSDTDADSVATTARTATRDTCIPF